MKNGMFEPGDGEKLMRIYEKVDVCGELKEPLSCDEQVLLYCIAKRLRDKEDSRWRK